MKYSIITIALFIMLALSSCVNIFKLADIRTDEAKLDGNHDKAVALIQQMQKAHKIENWKDIESYRVLFSDEFYGLVGKASHPFKEQKVDFELSYIPNTYDGRMKFLSGKQKGTEWGVQSWNSYYKTSNEELIFKPKKDIIFWVPTYQYFIEFANRISSANAFSYAGKETVEGIACEGVLASWNNTAPQKDIDQYLIWIDQNTKRIVKIEYTVRDAYKFVAGAAIFKNYKEFDGILIPTSMPVESNLINHGYLHQMTISNFEITKHQTDYIRPNKSIEAIGDRKI